MARVIHTNSPGKRRNAHRRSCAELLRRLSQQAQVNAESQDMAAALVFCLRAIDETIEESIVAWEKRGYWKKADAFQRQWAWAARRASALERTVKGAYWQELPQELLQLLPHVSDIKITRLTRDPASWAGAYNKLLAEPPREPSSTP